MVPTWVMHTDGRPGVDDATRSMSLGAVGKGKSERYAATRRWDKGSHAQLKDNSRKAGVRKEGKGKMEEARR